jgi:hypothetical protein
MEVPVGISTSIVRNWGAPSGKKATGMKASRNRLATVIPTAPSTVASLCRKLQMRAGV